MGLLFWGLIGAVAGSFIVSLMLGPNKRQIRQADAMLKQMAQESEARQKTADKMRQKLNKCDKNK